MKISVCGNIGCGKSTLLSELKKKGYNVKYEPVEKWTFLDQFYKNMRKWSFQLQVQVLYSFISNKDIDKAPITIYERSPQESCNIFSKSLMKQNFLTKQEFNLIEDMTQTLSWKPDIVIYLRCDPKTCKSRVEARGRDCENDISIQYLEDLHELYETYPHDYVIDASLLKEEICMIAEGIINATVSRYSV